MVFFVLLQSRTPEPFSEVAVTVGWNRAIWGETQGRYVPKLYSRWAAGADQAIIVPETDKKTRRGQGLERSNSSSKTNPDIRRVDCSRIEKNSIVL